MKGSYLEEMDGQQFVELSSNLLFQMFCLNDGLYEVNGTLLMGRVLREMEF